MSTIAKKYLDYDGLSVVASKVKEKLQKVTTIPASPSNGDAVLYIGTTSGNYIKGHIYQYNNNSWNDISPSGGGGGVSLESIAPIENSTTASQAYNIDDLLFLNDVLYKATSAITQGGTIIISGTEANVIETDIDTELKGKINISNGYKISDSTRSALADTDYFPFYYNVVSGSSRKTTWSNIKSKLKTYFDSIYSQEEWVGTASVQNGSATFSGIDDSSNNAYEIYFDITSTTEKNPTATISSLTGAGSSNMTIVYTTDADEGSSCKLRKIK